MSTTDEIGLYITVFIVLFCMALSFLTFLKFESENIKKEGLSFTLSGVLWSIFVKPLKFFCSCLKKIFFSIGSLFNKKVIKKIASPTSFLKFIVVVFRGVKAVPKKIMYYECKFPVHWHFGNLILIVGFLFFCILYGGYFGAVQYGVSILLILSLLFILVFLSLVIFALQYGYEKTKYAFYFFVFLNVITVTFSPYITTDFFSSYSDVPPEKVIRLLYFMNVVAYVFCFYLLLYIVYYFLTICLMCWKLYFFLYSKFNLFIENPKQNSVRQFFSGDWNFLLLFLSCLSVPFAALGGVLGSPSDRFEQIMSEYMLTKNNDRCGGLEDDDKIYFYEQGRVLHYIPQKVDKEENKKVDEKAKEAPYRMKYMDYKCKNEPKEEPNETKLIKKTVL